MKRILAIVIASLLCLASLFSLSVFAEEEAKVNVKVSVTTKNSIKAGLVDVAAGDEDGDGAITISDALYVAHEIYCTADVILKMQHLRLQTALKEQHFLKLCLKDKQNLSQ